MHGAGGVRTVPEKRAIVPHRDQAHLDPAGVRLDHKIACGVMPAGDSLKRGQIEIMGENSGDLMINRGRLIGIQLQAAFFRVPENQRWL